MYLKQHIKLTSYNVLKFLNCNGITSFDLLVKQFEPCQNLKLNSLLAYLSSQRYISKIDLKSSVNYYSITELGRFHLNTLNEKAVSDRKQKIYNIVMLITSLLTLATTILFGMIK